MKHRNKDWLQETYWNQKLSTRKMGMLAGVSYSTIQYWMKKHGIRRRTVSVACRGDGCSNWRGGRKYHSDGYVQLYRPTHPRADAAGYVMEHRLVMEEDLDRLLTPEENVHHINGTRDDNRKENLTLFPAWVRHMAFHRERQEGRRR